MKVPNYVWISCVVLLSFAELRKWADLILTFSENEEEKENEEIPEGVKHMFI